jgi:hypothetical protein
VKSRGRELIVVFIVEALLFSMMMTIDSHPAQVTIAQKIIHRQNG